MLGCQVSITLFLSAVTTCVLLSYISLAKVDDRAGFRVKSSMFLSTLFESTVVGPFTLNPMDTLDPLRDYAHTSRYFTRVLSKSQYLMSLSPLNY